MKTCWLMPAILVLLPSVALAQTIPAGWKSRREGDEVTVTPRGLKADQVFSVTALRDEVPAGRKVRAWFIGRVKQDSVRIGTVVKDAEVKSVSGDVLSQSLVVRDRAGAVFALMYFGGLGKTGAFELYRIISSPDRALAAAYMADASKIIDSWPSRPLEEVAAGGRAGRERKEEPEDKTAAYRTQPGAGIKPSEVEMFASEMYMKPSLDLSVTPAYRPVMLLKNGEFCDRLDVPPSDMNVAAHKQANPSWWGKWRRRGDGFERLSRKGEWEKVDWKMRLYPARPGDQLSGTFSNIAGDGMAGSRVVASRKLTFLPGGRFQYDGFGSVSTPNAVGSSSSKKTGTYKLDGSTIELRYEDGTVDRRSFLAGSRKMEAIFLNTSLFAVRD